MSILDKIDELTEKQMGVAQGPDPVDKITAKAVADCLQVIKVAAKKAAKASGKPEGRLEQWIKSKVKFSFK